MHFNKKSLYLTLLPILAVLAGCNSETTNDGFTDNPDSPSVGISVGGSGVKGPLAGAVVNLYQADLSQADLKGSLLATGETGPNAGIQNLDAPEDISGLMLLEFVVDADTVDLTTGVAPVFNSLITVVNAQRIIDGNSIYASPLTTMAVKLAIRKADSGAPFAGNGDDSISEDEFNAALTVAQRQVKSTLGFGMSSTTDIFTVPPLITNETADATSQAEVAAYRRAIEAVAAISAAVSTSGGGADPQAAFDALTEDLSDGDIDGQSDTGSVAAFETVTATLVATVTQDVSTLTIPGSTRTVGEITTVLAEETSSTGTTTDTTDLGSGNVEVPPTTTAQVASDIDGDGVPDSEDEFPEDETEYVDFDGDGFGDNEDDAFPQDADNWSDADSDGFGDQTDDAFTDDADNWTDADGDGFGDQTDDAFPDDADNWTDADGDGFGDETDDAFPDDATEWVDADEDGFGDNEDDLFPDNPNLQMDQDQDGVDDSIDNCVEVFNPNQEESDDPPDGAGDACDAPETPTTPTLIWDDPSTTWDNANWG